MSNEQNIMNIIVACCVLHNIYIISEDDNYIEAYIREGMTEAALLHGEWHSQ